VKSLLVAVAMCVATAAAAQPAPPELTAAVNDFANVIDRDHERQISDLVERLKAAATDVIVVATIKTFQPWPDIQSYTVKMFENHGKGIGVKGKDNGVLILLAVDDRTVRVEPGYGLEGVITDGFSGEVSRDTMRPYFRDGNYGEGLLAGVTRIAQRIAQDRNVDLGIAPQEERRSSRRGGSMPLIVWIILFIIVMRAIRRGGGGPRGGLRRRGGWSSGVGPFIVGYGMGRGWGHGGGGGFGGGGFGGFGGGRSGGGGGGASW
jgi:uncharacterized protein